LDALLEQIGCDYDLVCETIQVGPIALQFYRVADPETLLTDEVLKKTHDELTWQPYWAESWDTAHGMALELCERSLHDTNVLDLGCGLGLTGTIAAAVGARVVMADYAPPALLFAQLNSWPYRQRVEVRRVDWRRDELDRQFDLIVGSDILYDRGDLPYLNDFWQRHLMPGGSVLLGDPTRALTNAMLDWIGNQQWLIMEHCRTTPVSERTIRIVELHPKSR
jgi:predicted nicotinamide N-methyase